MLMLWAAVLVEIVPFAGITPSTRKLAPVYVRRTEQVGWDDFAVSAR
jgi:hypothetical protein